MSSGSRTGTSCTCPDAGVGALRRRGRAAVLRRWLRGALAAVALHAPAARAETQVEPIARLTLEGGYDSNVLFDGRSDTKTRASPELGVRLRAPLWIANGVYGADYLNYRKLQPNGVWNHHLSLDLHSSVTERLRVRGVFVGTYATDPVGLAQAGVFRAGEVRALTAAALAHSEYDATRLLLVGGDLNARVVRFEDRTGGAMYAPSVELLRRLSERFLVGGAFASSLFQDFDPAGDRLAFAQAIRARGRYHLTRFLEADVFAGPALWSGPRGRSIVPEASAELRLVERDWALRLTAAHRLGLGTTAAPGLVDSIEAASERRFGRTFDLIGYGGLWRTGDVPSGNHSTLGYSVSAEGGWYVTRELRLALAASYLARLDNSSPLLRRATLGIRMGWILPAR